MATYSFVFDEFKDEMYSGYNFLVDNGFRICLVNGQFVEGNNYVTNRQTKLWANIPSAYKITTTDKAVGAYTVDKAGVGVIVKAVSDAVWSMSTITDAYGAVIYDATDLLVCYIDFGGPQTSQNGTFSVPISKGFIQS